MYTHIYDEYNMCLMAINASSAYINVQSWTTMHVYCMICYVTTGMIMNQMHAVYGMQHYRNSSRSTAAAAIRLEYKQRLLISSVLQCL